MPYFEIKGQLVHVNIPTGRYIGQVRRTGARTWRTVTGNLQCLRRAMAKAVMAMERDDMRCRVLFVPTCGYYESSVVMEAKRS
jgi:hypothetical protein